MLIFIDTEFSDLKSANPKLLSIGMVTDDGKSEFYAEIPEGDGWTRRDCADFTLEDVLPLMWGGEYEVSSRDLPDRIKAWLKILPGAHMIASDNSIDVRFLSRLLHPTWPENLERKWIDVGNMVGSPAFTKAVDVYLQSAHERYAHHALIDARANREGWLAWAGPYEDRLKMPGEIREEKLNHHV